MFRIKRRVLFEPKSMVCRISVVCDMTEEGRIPRERSRTDREGDISVRKLVDIGVLHFERWNRLEKEASSHLLNALTHESFALRVLDCWVNHAR